VIISKHEFTEFLPHGELRESTLAGQAPVRDGRGECPGGWSVGMRNKAIGAAAAMGSTVHKKKNV
jgi:hypothetical protein